MIFGNPETHPTVIGEEEAKQLNYKYKEEDLKTTATMPKVDESDVDGNQPNNDDTKDTLNKKETAFIDFVKWVEAATFLVGAPLNKTDRREASRYIYFLVQAINAGYSIQELGIAEIKATQHGLARHQEAQAKKAAK